MTLIAGEMVPSEPLQPACAMWSCAGAGRLTSQPHLLECDTCGRTWQSSWWWQYEVAKVSPAGAATS